MQAVTIERFTRVAKVLPSFLAHACLPIGNKAITVYTRISLSFVKTDLKKYTWMPSTICVYELVGGGDENILGN